MAKASRVDQRTASGFFLFWALLSYGVFPSTGALAAPKKPAIDERTKLEMDSCLSGNSVAACARAAVRLEKSGHRREAAPFYKKACLHPKKPQGSACFLWGLLLPKAKRAPVFRRACTLKDGDACTSLGEILRRQKKPLAAAPLYEKGCALGDGRGCHRAGYFALKGIWPLGKPDQALVLRYFQRSCQLRYGYGCIRAGMIAQRAKRLLQAHSFFAKGCALRQAQSCLRQGVILLQQKQKKQAKALFVKACQMGLRRACSL